MEQKQYTESEKAAAEKLRGNEWIKRNTQMFIFTIKIKEINQTKHVIIILVVIKHYFPLN